MFVLPSCLMLNIEHGQIKFGDYGHLDMDLNNIKDEIDYTFNLIGSTIRFMVLLFLDILLEPL